VAVRASNDGLERGQVAGGRCPGEVSEVLVHGAHFTASRHG
jgi:hypothetical protein